MQAEQTYFFNAASLEPGKHDARLKQELEYAGVPITRTPEFICHKICNGEVLTTAIGDLHGWTFIRYWHYWVVTGPGLDFAVSMDLWKLHGKYIRVKGDCGCRSPWLWNSGFAANMYHIDTSEGLKIFAELLNKTHADAEALLSNYDITGDR